MIRIYCDSNIYRYLNPKHISFNPDLLTVFEALKDKMLFTYSDAHLHDLRNTPANYADADLLLMGEYVKDNYFMHDFIKDKGTSPYLSTPIESFESKDYVKYNKVLDDPFDLDKLFDGMDDFPEGKLLKGIVKSIFDLPLMVLKNEAQTQQLSTEHKEMIAKMSPNYNSSMTLGEFINDMWPYSKGLLKDKRQLAEFRKYIRSYMDADDYSFEKWGLGFNERFKSSPFGKSFLEMIGDMISGKQKDDLYKRITQAYTMLELYGVTKERTKKGSKQFNMESLHTDGGHTWYASFSDYFVTNDKGLQVKSAIVYQLFGLPTRILSLPDFINSKSLLLSQEETSEKFAASLSYDLQHSLQLNEKKDLTNGNTITTYKTTYPYFNYFNRVQIVQSKDLTSYVLYCERNSHANFYMYREIELIVDKLIAMLGLDSDQRGKYHLGEDENYDSADCIRKWDFTKLKFALLTSWKSWGNFLCLCLDMKLS